MSTKETIIAFRATPEMKNKLRQYAAKDDRTISYVISKLLEEALNKPATPTR